MNNRLLYNYSLVCDAPIFQGLSSKIFEQILANSQVREIIKGQQIFLEGEEIKNLFVILKGKVKIFLVDQKGLENIIEIVNKYQIAGDFFSKYFLTSATALENCNLLTIPINDIRQAAKKDLKLALNLLNESENRNKILLKQVNSLKLFDAKEKVGKYLLQLSFKESKKTTNFKLNSNKAAIASFLGIKPETLSRALKKLQNDQEITIEKNIINLKAKDSLCKYCDGDIAKKCSHHNDYFCTQATF